MLLSGGGRHDGGECMCEHEEGADWAHVLLPVHTILQLLIETPAGRMVKGMLSVFWLHE